MKNFVREITRRHRTAFLFAIDRSLSMRGVVEMADGRTITKAECVACAVNNAVTELVLRATRDDGIRDYYDIAVLGYDECGVVPLIDPRRAFIPVGELEAYRPAPVRRLVERCDGEGRRVLGEEWTTMWIEPAASGSTPMYEALREVRNLLKGWCSDPRNSESFPPVVINITDGEASDCHPVELRAIAGEIKSLGTSEGRVLLMNIHITSGRDTRPMLFPSAAQTRPAERYAQLLAECSSELPPQLEPIVRATVGDGADAEGRRLAMGYDASPEALITLLNIGSRSVADIL